MKLIFVTLGLMACVWLAFYVAAGLVGLVALAVLCWPFVGGLVLGAYLVLSGSYYAAGVVVVVGILGQIVWAVGVASKQHKQVAIDLDPLKDPHFVRSEMEFQRRIEEFDRKLHGDKRPKLFGPKNSNERERKV